MSEAALTSPRRDWRGERAAHVAQLYLQGDTHAAIRLALNLTKSQLLTTLADLFAEGMPKRNGHVMTDRQVRSIHKRYLNGGSIDRLSEAKGFSGATARRRMHKLNLPLDPQARAKKLPSTPLRAEQHEITRIVVARVERRREALRLSSERLANSCGLSLWTLYNFRNRHTDPRLTTLLKLAYGLGISPTDLVRGLPIPVEPDRGADRERAHT